MENSKLKRVVTLVLSVLMISGVVFSTSAASVAGTSGKAATEESSTTSEALEILGDDTEVHPVS